MSTLNPYLSFRDNARQAMEFYESVFGGELTLSTFGDSPMSEEYPDEGAKILHGQLVTPSGFTLMGADTPSSMEHNPGDAYAVSLSGDEDAELRGWWEKLTDGATVTAPLNPAPWGDTFGMLTDKFGVNWMVNIAGSPS
ncbi:MAG: VOC family protein [Actinomycetota bacterium]|nr:VOC family protein [Actinomycetota bacterium]